MKVLLGTSNLAESPCRGLLCDCETLRRLVESSSLLAGGGVDLHPVHGVAAGAVSLAAGGEVVLAHHHPQVVRPHNLERQHVLRKLPTPAPHLRWLVGMSPVLVDGVVVQAVGSGDHPPADGHNINEPHKLN